MSTSRGSGGGGLGDPFRLDPDRVLDDVLDEKLSVEAARRDYGVVIDPETLTLDQEATREVRRADSGRR